MLTALLLSLLAGVQDLSSQSRLKVGQTVGYGTFGFHQCKRSRVHIFSTITEGIIPLIFAWWMSGWIIQPIPMSQKQDMSQFMREHAFKGIRL